MKRPLVQWNPRIAFYPHRCLALTLVLFISVVCAFFTNGCYATGRLAFAQGLRTQNQTRVVLPGHVLTLPRGAVPIAATRDFLEQPLTITVVLNRFNQKGFDSFVRSVNDPTAKQFGHFITQEEVRSTFGPSEEAYKAVRRYLTASDLAVIQDSKNQLTITATGRRSLIERTFGVRFQNYRLRGRTFYATRTNPSVPVNVARYIQAIVGLSNLASPRPGVVFGQNQPSTTAFNPAQLAKAYDVLGVGKARGQKIALLEFDSFRRSDLQQWISAMKMPQTILSRVAEVPVAGGTLIRSQKGEGEVLLDLEIVMGMAPEASYSVYEARDLVSFQEMVNAMINDHATVISNSWSECESQSSAADLDSLDSVFEQGLASGISAFNASGDNGSICPGSGKDEVASPADVPNAMGVGGTSLSVGPGSSYEGESWWPNGGFGISAHFPVPSYLRPSIPSGVKSRPVPDFVADADLKTGISVYQQDMGGWYVAGGTSMSTPIWAAAVAVMNERLGPSGLVTSWVAKTQCAGAIHTPRSMQGPDNDQAHLGFGSVDLVGLVNAKKTLVAKH